MYLYPNAMNLMSNTNTMNSIASSNLGSVPLIRKRRPVGRRRRDIFLSSTNGNKTYDEAIATPDPEEMYSVLIHCAENFNFFTCNQFSCNNHI